MLIVKVKICGITNYEDASTALDLGADMLGFNFYRPSPRYIEPEAASDIIVRLPAVVDTVGVFVNSPVEEIRQIMERCSLDWVQLHGDESPEFCMSLNSVHVKTMKALRVKDERDIEKAEDYFTDAILLDAFDPERYGGTGLTFDWNIVGHIGKRVFLAGGLNAENAPDAIKLGVYGIDLCSGLEADPGKKDHEKMKRLFDNIKHIRG